MEAIPGEISQGRKLCSQRVAIMKNVEYRPFRPEDLETLREIMVEAFHGVSIDHGIEQVHGEINGHDWKWRKGRHLDEDLRRDPDGIIVAESDGQVVGFISVWMDQEAGIGHIPNISIRPAFRGQGIGRTLIQMVMSRFRAAGLTHAKIETLEQNAIGNHLYTDCGFREVARQVHFVASLHETEED